MPDNTPSDPTDQKVEDYTYVGLIPKLGPAREGDMYSSLLPIYGGQPGLEYLQCPVVSQKDWQSAGWKPVRNCSVYTIKGPLGSIDCVLLVTGVRLHSSDHQSNKRKLFLDPEIERITGLNHLNGTSEMPDGDLSEKAHLSPAAAMQDKLERKIKALEEQLHGKAPQESQTQSALEAETQSWREA